MSKSRLAFFLNSFCFLSLILLLFSGCSDYQRVLKSDDRELKLEAAKEYYNKGQYYKALPLFEELIPLYRGRPELEDIYYFYSYSHFGQDNYLLAAFNFKNYVQYFPNGAHTEDAQYMTGYSYYMAAPGPELEQTQSQRAIDAFQLFINRYPQSEKVAEANTMIDDLRKRMETKAMMGAQLYYDMGNYKAAAVSFENVLEEYPETEQGEQVHLLIVKALYRYAANSVEARQRERYADVITAYNEFVSRYPESKFLNEAQMIYVASTQRIKNLEENEQY